MPALTVDRQTTFFEGDLAEHTVAANTEIFLGALVSLNSAGLAIPANGTTAGQTFAGVAVTAADNLTITLERDRVDVVEVRRTGIHEYDVTFVVTRADIGSDVFAVDDQTVSLVQSTGNAPVVGIIAKFVQADVADVDVAGALTPQSQSTTLQPETFAASCTSLELVGNFVRVSAASTVRNVDFTAVSEMHTAGVIISKATATSCVVQPRGVVSGLYSGLTPGAALFVDASARPVAGFSNPVIGIRYIQNVAIALTANDILVSLRPPVGVLPL